MRSLKIPLIVSIFADNVKNFVRVAEKLAWLRPLIIELNLSCPNTEDDLGRMFALDQKKTAEVLSKVKKVTRKTKIFVKLTADNPDISEVAKAAEAAGADGITAINTVSGLIIDIRIRKPILTNKYGGLSGPAIKPIAVRAVYNIYKVVKIPIIGLGGIITGEDVIEFIMAGATAMGIGTAIYYRGLEAF